MNREEVGQIVFDERHIVSAERTAQCPFRQLPLGQLRAGTCVDTVTTGQLVTLLESLCLAEIERYLDPDAERALGHSIELRCSASIPRGALLRIRGWVHRISDRDVTFFVHAQDDHEQVCEGTIRLVVVRRGELERRIERKIETIARRELFLAA
jgi:fluoroacetyl-CoA thioesterase